MRTALAQTVDLYRLDAAPKLDPDNRARLGQYMTPAPICRFMASLFEDVSGDVRVLDPGAGVGSLTAAFVERCAHEKEMPRSVTPTCYEIEPLLAGYLQATLREARECGKAAGVAVSGAVRAEDFVLLPPGDLADDLFGAAESAAETFTHAIMNPPYRKISALSPHRAALRRAGIETSNLYTGFMFLAARSLGPGGEMVAIVPRSFCNGPYFKPFRERFFSMMGLRRVHVFEKRDSAFGADNVLQENIIVHAVKGAEPSTVEITTSRGGGFEYDAGSRECAGEDMTRRLVDYAAVISPSDPGGFVHIAASGLEQRIVDRMAHFTATLRDLGVEVSTGPVVDFRLRRDLRAQPEKGTVPLLYPVHFRGGELEWPKETGKPNAIAVSDQSRKWLYPNEGCFVVTRRFTSKEERRRVVASVCPDDLPGVLVGFENHLNVYHANRKGVPETLAAGLAAFLNSSLVDRYFRQFSGHTQVNAADLRSLRYPDRDALERIGTKARGIELTQRQIDALVEEELTDMTDDEDPLEAQRKIDEAMEIVKAFGMPRGQQNERSALTLLALLDLGPGGVWNDLRRPLMGITPIMDYCRERYGREYAPNTRETFRRQTMHQFVEAGIALYNPDSPDRPVNSPKACYQISEEAFGAIATFGTDAWHGALDAYLKGRETLVAKWAKHRDMRMVPVRVAEGREISLTPGPHSVLIKQIIDEFAARFAPGAVLIYVGDTGDKVGFFEEAMLSDLGVAVDQHGKMPDVVLYHKARDWLLIVESVTSHGPVDAKRHNELGKLFSATAAGLVYVTAFPDRSVMARHIGQISWETEVWCADAPTHLIHFDGERFLGPYERQGS